MSSTYSLIRDLDFTETKVRKRIQNLYWGSLLLSFAMLVLGASGGESIVQRLVGSIGSIVNAFSYHSFSSSIPFFFEILLANIFYSLAPIAIFGAAVWSLYSKQNNVGLLIIITMPIASLALTLIYFVSHLIFSSGSPGLVGFFQFNASYGFLAMVQDWFFFAGSMWVLGFLCYEPAVVIYKYASERSQTTKQTATTTYAIGEIVNGYRFTGTGWELIE